MSEFTPDTVVVADPTTGGVKGSKVCRFDLVPPEAERALAEHFGKNCKEHGGKYEARNWEKGYAWSLSYGALKRHLDAWWQGEDIDAESGSHHLTAVAWHAFVLFTYAVRGRGTDDRPRTGDPREQPRIVPMEAPGEVHETSPGLERPSRAAMLRSAAVAQQQAEDAVRTGSRTERILQFPCGICGGNGQALVGATGLCRVCNGTGVRS